MFFLYEGRARSNPPANCGLLDAVDTEEEARKAGNTTWAGKDVVWFEETTRGETSIMGVYTEFPGLKMRLDLPPNQQEPAKEAIPA